MEGHQGGEGTEARTVEIRGEEGEAQQGTDKGKGVCLEIMEGIRLENVEESSLPDVLEAKLRVLRESPMDVPRYHLIHILRAVEIRSTECDPCGSLRTWHMGGREGTEGTALRGDGSGCLGRAPLAGSCSVGMGNDASSNPHREDDRTRKPVLWACTGLVVH